MSHAPHDNPRYVNDGVMVTFNADELVVLIAALRNRYVKESVKRPLMGKLVEAHRDAR